MPPRMSPAFPTRWPTTQAQLGLEKGKSGRKKRTSSPPLQKEDMTLPSKTTCRQSWGEIRGRESSLSCQKQALKFRDQTNNFRKNCQVSNNKKLSIDQKQHSTLTLNPQPYLQAQLGVEKGKCVKSGRERKTLQEQLEQARTLTPPWQSGQWCLLVQSAWSSLSLPRVLTFSLSVCLSFS